MESDSSRDATIVRRKRAPLIRQAFLAACVGARGMVFRILARTLPDSFHPVHGPHVHHLSYGIFPLDTVGAWMWLRPPQSSRGPAVLYGGGLASTVDEFRVGRHLGGRYGQRASRDAIVVVGVLPGLFAFGQTLGQYRPHHWATAPAGFAVTMLSIWMLVKSLDYAGRRMLPTLQRDEEKSPP